VLICPEKSRPEDNKEKQLLVYDRHVDTWVRCRLAAHSSHALLEAHATSVALAAQPCSALP